MFIDFFILKDPSSIEFNIFPIFFSYVGHCTFIQCIATFKYFYMYICDLLVTDSTKQLGCCFLSSFFVVPQYFLLLLGQILVSVFSLDMIMNELFITKRLTYLHFPCFSKENSKIQEYVSRGGGRKSYLTFNHF